LSLRQDQLRALEALLDAGPGGGAGPLRAAVRPCAYDGDVPPPARAALRRRCNVFLTNPDMLHAALLPAHAQWRAVRRMQASDAARIPII
jgi:DEAD/DEAH box helicase domain-containing protein